MSSSLSRFSGWRSRSLSLGEGLTDSTGARDGTRGLRRALSPTFPAGEMVFFIPWRGVAEDSGAAHLDLLGPPGWSPLGCWPADDGDVVRRRAPEFLFSDIPDRGRRRSSRRSERPTMRPLWSYGVLRSQQPDRKPHGEVSLLR